VKRFGDTIDEIGLHSFARPILHAAVSRDVERDLALNFGDRVLLHGLGVFEFHDRMAPRWSLKADVFMHSDQKARSFGVKRQIVLVKLV